MKKQSTRKFLRQMIYISVLILVFSILGRVASDATAGMRINNWSTIEFADTNIPHEFVIEKLPNGIKAMLTNTGEEELLASSDFLLAQMDENGEWRIFPFSSEVQLAQVLMPIVTGYSLVYHLTEDMLIRSFSDGMYRIITGIWCSDDETQTLVWAEFELITAT